MKRHVDEGGIGAVQPANGRARSSARRSVWVIEEGDCLERPTTTANTKEIDSTSTPSLKAACKD